MPANTAVTGDVLVSDLLDVRGMSLADILDDSDTCTAMDIALERILSNDNGCNFNSFNSSI